MVTNIPAKEKKGVRKAIIGSPKKDQEIRIRTTPTFKLKPKLGRHFQAINLQNQFGFIPETIIFERLIGQKNMFVVRAILTPEEIEKEKKLKILAQ